MTVVVLDMETRIDMNSDKMDRRSHIMELLYRLAQLKLTIVPLGL